MTDDQKMDYARTFRPTSMDKPWVAEGSNYHKFGDTKHTEEHGASANAWNYHSSHHNQKSQKEANPSLNPQQAAFPTTVCIDNGDGTFTAYHAMVYGVIGDPV